MLIQIVVLTLTNQNDRQHIINNANIMLKTKQNSITIFQSLEQAPDKIFQW